jgi:hypothetical protein
VKYSYKAFPRLQPDPITKLAYVWKPVLQVLIWYNHKRSGLLESIVDTGADHCIFDAEIGDDLGIPIRKGKEVPFAGIAVGAKTIGYLHTVTLTVAAQTYQAPVVFAYGISATGILGQIGFFDHFIVTFDWTPEPPTFEVQRIARH